MSADHKPSNFLTFDIEDYYHLFYRNLLDRNVEPTKEVEICTLRILDILDRNGVKATFFVLGRVARRFADLVKKIAAAGHEVASHGYDHVYVNRIEAKQFREDLSRSKRILEDLTGNQVKGFRAPEFSIDRSTPWAFDVIAETGFRYDSSIFPVKTARYGIEGAPQGPHVIHSKSGDLLEIPLSTVTILNKRLPVAGGGYLRVLPFPFSCWAIRRINREGRPAVVYMHPYEFEPNPHPIDFSNCGLKRRVTARFAHLKQLKNRKKSGEKLEALIRRYRFGRISDGFPELLVNLEPTR